jgi:hypothetical protein
VNNVDLTPEEIDIQLAELIEQDERKDDHQESGMVVYEVEDKANKKEPKIKKPFTLLSKEEIEKLSKREQFEYKIELSKVKTEELKNEYRSYKSKQTETNRSRENKRLIIMGRFLETYMYKRPEHKIKYMVVEGHLDQYLTKDCDRQLLGFPLLGNVAKENYDNN